MQESIPLKHCYKCKEYKPATSEFFSLLQKAPDHLQYECKSCAKLRRDQKRAENPKPLHVPPTTKRCTKCHNEKPNTEVFFQRFTRKKNGRTYLMSTCKECNNAKCREYHRANIDQRKEYSRNYRLQNKDSIRFRSQLYLQEKREQIAERHRRRYQTHGEALRESNRLSYQAHKETRKAWQRRYRQDNKDRVHESHRRYDFAHAEQIREYQRTYRKSNPLKFCEYRHQHRARKKAAPGTITRQQIMYKLKAQRHRCYYAACGHAKFKIRNGKYVFHIEHTVPLSRPEAGPRNDINFIVLSCPSCNLRKHNKLPHEFGEGGRLF